MTLIKLYYGIYCNEIQFQSYHKLKTNVYRYWNPRFLCTFNHRLLYHSGVSRHETLPTIVQCYWAKVGYVTYTKSSS